MSEARSPGFRERFENLLQPIITEGPGGFERRRGRSLSGGIRATREREKEVEIEVGGSGLGEGLGESLFEGGGLFGRRREGRGIGNGLDHIAEAFAFKGGEIFFCSLLGSILGGLLAWGLGLFLLTSSGVWLICCFIRCLCRVAHFFARIATLFFEEFLPLWLVQLIRVVVKIGKAIELVIHDIEADLLHAIIKIALRLLETLCYWLEARLENFVSYGDSVFERRFVRLKERFGALRDGRRHWF